MSRLLSLVSCLKSANQEGCPFSSVGEVKTYCSLLAGVEEMRQGHW